MTQIPGETPSNWQEIFFKKALDDIKKHPFEDPRAQEISEYWLLNSLDITRQKAHAIGMLWLTEILGASEKAAREFAEGDVGSREIGLLHTGVNGTRMDHKSFWNGVRNAVPEMVKDQDFAYLLGRDIDASLAWTMISHIDRVNPRSDFLTTHLVTNALLYK